MSKSIEYRQSPLILDGEFKVDPKEMFFYQYLPIKMRGDWTFELEERLKPFVDIIEACIDDFVQSSTYDNFLGHYVYLSAKNLFITPGTNLNRPGYHSDGFLSDDINYVWCNSVPTIWNDSPFNISLDHSTSLNEFKNQALFQNDHEIPVNRIARLNQFVVHRPGLATETICRCFLKLSFSKERYNLKGNSHNYELDYDWEMKERDINRNHPIKK